MSASTATFRATISTANLAAQAGIQATGNLFDSAAESVGMLHSYVQKEALLQRRSYEAEISIRTQELSMQLTKRTVEINKEVASLDESAKSIYDNLLAQMQKIE